MEVEKYLTGKYLLKQVHLSGFRSIQQTSIDLKSNLSIIIGKNGAGKTNFLTFLNFVLNNKTDDFGNISSKLRFENSKTIEIEVEAEQQKNILHTEQIITSAAVHFRVTVNNDDFNYRLDEQVAMLNLLKKEKCIASATLIEHGVPQPYFLVNHPYTLTLIHGIPDFNISKTLPRLPYFTASLLFTFILELQQENVDLQVPGLLNQAIRSKIQQLVSQQLDFFKPILQQLSPIEDVRISNDFHLFIQPNDQGFTVKNLFLEFMIEGSWLPFTSLSDGTQRLFYIISEVASPDLFFFRYDWSGKADRSDNRIVLIEEPELGIHPHQLHKLMRFLKEQSKTKQIIITTHSPEALNVLASDELDSIILSYHDKKEGTLLRHLSPKEKEKAKLYMDEDYLSDYWMHSNLEPVN